MSEAHRNVCFIIMPFKKTTKVHTEEYWTKHYSLFLKPLIEEIPAIEACRSRPLRGDMLKQIITDIVISPVVVADLTDCNPNVYWELGVRQSFKHGTITIAEAGTKLPFDIGAKGTLFYHPNNHLKNAEFERQLKTALKDCMNSPHRPDSHVLETISGRGTLFEIFHQEEARRRLDALLSECEMNLRSLKCVASGCKRNIDNPKNRHIFTGRLRTSAAGLLVTNRYIDENASFFLLAESCLSEMVTLNDQFCLWEGNPLSTEEWLMKNIGNVINDLEQLKTLATAAYSKIVKVI